MSDQSLGQRFRTAVALSPVGEKTARRWTRYGYRKDLGQIQTALLILTGTRGWFESRVVAPKDQILKIYRQVSGFTILARKANMSHIQMQYAGLGYVTAWVLWQLKGQDQAGQVFEGDKAEINVNPLYQTEK